MSKPQPAKTIPIPKQVPEGAPNATVKVESASGTVIVASKIPHDIIVQLYQPCKRQVQGRFGPHEESFRVPTGKQYLIRGTSRPVGAIPKGYPAAPDMEEGYALTSNIPADFWEQWIYDNRDTDMVRNRVIFAVGDRASAKDIARENTKVRSGLDPLDMSAGTPDPRAPRPITTQIEPLKTAEITR